MSDLLPLCQNCENITQYCQHLDDGVQEIDQSHGGIDVAKVITEENFRECPDWVQVGPLQQEMRDRLYGMTGFGLQRMLWDLPEVSNGIKAKEMEELMEEERPDFYGMLYEGIASSGRDTQLRYESDEAGNLLVETDSTGDEFYRARPDYQLKAYASDPEGPIKADRNKILFWTINEVIDLILRSEIEQGLVIKEKKVKQPAVNPAQLPPGAQESVEMSPTAATAGKRVRVNKAGPVAQAPAGGQRRVTGRPPPSATPPQAPARAAPPPARMPPPVAGARPPQAGPGRVARPPARVGVRAPVPQQAPIDQPVEAAASMDLGPVLAAIEAIMDHLNKLERILYSYHIEDKSERALAFDLGGKTGGTFQYPKMQAVVDNQGNQVLDEDNQPAVEAVVDEQGNQVMETLPAIFNKPGQLMAFADDSAYNEDPEQAAGE